MQTLTIRRQDSNSALRGILFKVSTWLADTDNEHEKAGVNNDFIATVHYFDPHLHIVELLKTVYVNSGLFMYSYFEHVFVPDVAAVARAPVR